MLDFYSILGISENATSEEIKHTYHKKSKRFHLDNQQDAIQNLDEQMALINEAYDVLSDIAKREIYDAERKLQNGTSADEEMMKADATYASEPKTYTQQTYETSHAESENSKGCSFSFLKVAFCIGLMVVLFNACTGNDDSKDDIKKGVNQVAEETGIGAVTKQFFDEVNTEYMKTKNPEDIVQEYLEYLRSGYNEKADDLFLQGIDDDFEPCTVQEFNKTITDLYYGFESDIPLYPLCEEIRLFEYEISSITKDANGERVDVSIYIENIDVALVMAGLLQMDAEDNQLESMSDKEIQELIVAIISQYGSVCTISSEITFELIRDENSVWKIQRITPLKDFSIIMVGQISDLILMLNGETVENDISEDEFTYDEEHDEEYFGDDYEDDSCAEDLLP